MCCALAAPKKEEKKEESEEEDDDMGFGELDERRLEPSPRETLITSPRYP